MTGKPSKPRHDWYIRTMRSADGSTTREIRVYCWDYVSALWFGHTHSEASFWARHGQSQLRLWFHRCRTLRRPVQPDQRQLF